MCVCVNMFFELCMGELRVCTCVCCVQLTAPEPVKMQLEFLLLDQSPQSNLS